jgi:hypothetical protein
MRLYDCEQSAQEDMIDKSDRNDYNYDDKEKPKKTFEGFKF